MRSGLRFSNRICTFYMVGLLVLLFILFFIIGFYYYSKEKEQVKQDELNELLAISDLKVAQLVDWQKSREADANYLSQSEPFSKYIKELLKGDRSNTNLLKENFTSFLNKEKYKSIYVTDSLGSVLLECGHLFDKNLSPIFEGKLLDSSTLKSIKQVFLTKNCLVNNFFDKSSNEASYYEFISPVVDSSGSVIATILFYIDPNKKVLPIINQWSKFNFMRESVLARNVGDSIQIVAFARDELGVNTALVDSFKVIQRALHLDNIAMDRSEWGSSGFFNGVDYGKDQTIGMYTLIPGTQWYLVEMTNTRQVFGRINRKAFFIAIIGAITFLFSIITILLLHSNKKRELEQSRLESEKEEEEFRWLLAQTRLELLAFSVKNNLDRTLREMQDRVGSVTNSPIGFVHFLEENEDDIALTAWSTETERQFAAIIGKVTHNPVSSAGVWAEAVRTREPVVHNNFASVPNKRGFPDGHPALIREIIIPVIRNNRVVSVLGIANKPTPYDSKDVYLATFMADVVWEIAEGKFKEEALKQSEEKYRGFFYNHSAINMVIDPSNGAIVDANNSAVQFYGWSLEELKKMNITEINTLPTYMLKEFRDKVLNYDNSLFELVQGRADGSLVDVDVYTGKVTIRGKPFIYSIVHDVTLKRYKEKSQDILYNITRSSMGSVTIEGLVSVVKQGLSSLLDVSSLCVALYVTEKNMLRKNNFNTLNCGRAEWVAINSLMGYVFSSRKSLHLTAKEVASFVLENDLVSPSDIPECWLGVPLVFQGKALGVLVLKSETDSNAYDSKSLVLMDMVAHELSAAIGRTQLIQDLVLAKDRAEESNRLKSAFLSNLSHEIRTPMNAILGFLDLISDPDFEDDLKDGFLEQVKLGSDRLIETLNNLVEISKIEAGRTRVDRSNVDVNLLLRETYGHFSAQAAAKGLELKLTINVPEEFCKIETDGEKIKNIFYNLLSNSLKFTQNGVVELGSFMEEERLFFYVNDTGCGIGPNKIKAVFNLFETENLELSRSYEGIGLGLSIVKSYVESLGGEITIDSKVGEYTSVRFYIPL